MVKENKPMVICSCSLGQITRLKAKLEELEKAASEMEQSQALVYHLAGQAHRFMTGLHLEQGFCGECLHNFDTKLELVCNKIDETTERTGHLSGLSEELWSDKEELFQCEEGMSCEGGHTK